MSAIDPQPGQALVEIGPGQGALTDHLLARVPRLTAVEIDRDLCARLLRRHPPERLELHQADALRFDFTSVAPAGRALRVVGNLPYNISSPLLVHLIDVRERVVDQHFLLQREVVERIVAEPSGSDYGRLGVLLQAFYRVERVFDVGPQAFDPPPDVHSALLRMIPRITDAPGVSAATLSQMLAAAFGQRRKMLRNTLLPWLEARGIAAPELSPTDRAQDLPVERFVELARRIEQAG